MNFLLSDDQQAFLDAIRPVLNDRCDSQQVHKIFDGDDPYDTALWSHLVAMGIPAIMIDKAHGGLGLQLLDLAIIAELLGEFAAPVPFFGNAIGALAIQLAGSAEQRANWLPLLATGERLATIAFGEGKGRWLPGEWEVPGGNSISGTKVLVPNAAEADLIIVGTRDGLALVERGAGYKTARTDSADRTRRLDIVTFDGTASEMMPGDGATIDRLIDATATLLAADAFGGATRCLERTVDYAKVREQYGQPIGAFQGLKHQLANMALEIEPSRGLYWFAAHAWDDLPDKARHAAAQAKAHCTDVYLQATRDMVEAHGGIGFTWEHDAHIYMKRAMFDWTWLGQPSLHRLRAADLAGW
ncbi:MAG: acyl-CoA dehydrogenase family protein [Sphingorhabdus sp.]